MTAEHWNGVGDYDYLLTMSENEMRELTDFYKIDWSFFTEGPSKNIGNSYYCFVSVTRNVIALLPFLSLLFGGMYSNLPTENHAQPFKMNYKYFKLEPYCDFSFS